MADMMGMGDNPVTLVVKAPNQRIEDQTIDCFLDWTVKKLKEHLEAVYPSNPVSTIDGLTYMFFLPEKRRYFSTKLSYNNL